MMHAGFGERDITPRPGMPLMGHTREEYASTGTHDPLYCRALVLRNSSGESLGFLTCDLCMIPAAMAERIQKEVSDIPLMISATHTHAGPAVSSLYGAPVLDEDELEIIIRKGIEAVRDAAAALETVEMRYGEAVCESVAFYRRLEGRDGRTVMNWEFPEPESIEKPLGVPSEIVKVLEVRGKERVHLLVHFPLHPAILDYSNSLYSRDFVHFLGEGLQRIFPGKINPLFLNGCCGNVNHINYRDPDVPRRGYPAAQRVGHAIALAAAEAIKNAKPIKGEELRAVFRPEGLHRIAVPEKLLSQAKEQVRSSFERKGSPEAAIDGLPPDLQAPLIIEAAALAGRALETGIAVFRIGELPVFGLPGEVFCELGRMIEEGTAGKRSFVLELVNDAIGYIPTWEAFSQGGYETQIGVTGIAPGEGERLVEIALEGYRTLFPDKGDNN